MQCGGTCSGWCNHCMCSQQWLQQQPLLRWHESCVIELVGAGLLLLLLPIIWWQLLLCPQGHHSPCVHWWMPLSVLIVQQVANTNNPVLLNVCVLNM
jgi:hypothetical protein